MDEQNKQEGVVDRTNQLIGSLQKGKYGKKFLVSLGRSLGASAISASSFAAIIIVGGVFLTFFFAIISGGPAASSELPPQGQAPKSVETTGLLNISGESSQFDAVKSVFGEAFSYSLYKNLITAAGPINIDLNSEPIDIDNTKGCSGIVINDKITVSGLSFCATFDKRYILFHESGHILGNRNKRLYQLFPHEDLKTADSSCYAPNGYLKSYRYDVTEGRDGGPKDESFAESVALFLLNKKGLITNFQSECKSTYNWFKTKVFGL